MENFSEIVAELKMKQIKLEENIKKLEAAKAVKSESDELNELFTALAKAQGEIETALKDKSNPIFESKYADLASVFKAAKPALSKNNLSVIQRILVNGGGAMYLFTRLCHSSGQWIESKMPINVPKLSAVATDKYGKEKYNPKNDIQMFGMYLTYLKRYSFSAMIGVASEEDDDGNSSVAAAQEQSRQDTPASEAQMNYIKSMIKRITPEQLESLYKYVKIDSLDEVNSSNCQAIIKYLQKMIKG